MQKISILFSIFSLLLLVFLFSACGPTVNRIKPQEPVNIQQSFQRSLTPLPTVPAYRCGAWTSTNAPNPYSSIALYARLTKDVSGVPGATAQAVVHFKSSDVTLDARPVSDSGGYVNFMLPLQGRQPALSAATVDISFQLSGQTIHCSQAFFTPQ